MSMKKILSIVFILALAGFLVYGAINRTSARYTTPRQSSQNGGIGVNRGNNSYYSDRDSENVLEPQIERDEEGDIRNGRGRQGRNSNIFEPEEQTLEESNRTDDWLQLNGIASRVDDTLLQVKVSELSYPVEIYGTPWAYVCSNGFVIDEGDELELKGFFNGKGRYQVCEITDLQKGETFTLRDADGYPLWATERGEGSGRSDGFFF